jgi:hypothetical protein
MSIFHLPLFQDKTILPTGKYHVSYSEVNTACGTDGCGWKHKLKYVDGHEEPGTEHTTYGTSIHSALQDWLLKEKSVWFDWEERIQECQKEVINAFSEIGFKPSDNELVKDWIRPVESMLTQIPAWMDENFPNWVPVAAELQLFEPIQGHTNKWFKGFVDAIIRVPKKPRKGSRKPASGYTYWIIDWKTTSWGWDMAKKQDKFKRMQLALYKHYVSLKLGIPLEDIKCGFVLLKRTAKKENLELLEVSVGDKTRQEAVDLVSNCVSMISKRFWLKNRNACRYCPFRGTEFCT